MPGKRAFVRMMSGRISVRVEIRESIELREATGVIPVHHMNLHLAEVPGKANLARRRNVLRGKEKNMAAYDNLVARADDLGAHAIAVLPVRDLGAATRR